MVSIHIPTSRAKVCHGLDESLSLSFFFKREHNLVRDGSITGRYLRALYDVRALNMLGTSLGAHGNILMYFIAILLHVLIKYLYRLVLILVANVDNSKIFFFPMEFDVTLSTPSPKNERGKINRSFLFTESVSRLQRYFSQHRAKTFPSFSLSHFSSFYVYFSMCSTVLHCLIIYLYFILFESHVF